jgi:hypothetical protein
MLLSRTKVPKDTVKPLDAYGEREEAQLHSQRHHARISDGAPLRSSDDVIGMKIGRIGIVKAAVWQAKRRGGAPGRKEPFRAFHGLRPARLGA